MRLANASRTSRMRDGRAIMVALIPIIDEAVIARGPRSPVWRVELAASPLRFEELKCRALAFFLPNPD